MKKHRMEPPYGKPNTAWDIHMAKLDKLISLLERIVKQKGTKGYG